MRQFFYLFILFPFFAGCSASSPEELERLTKEDPGFKQMILQRDQVHAEIHAVRDDLLAKKKAVDAQIAKWHREYDAYAKTQNQKIEKYQRAIEANGTVLKREMEMASARLESKLTERQGYEKTLADVKRVLNEGKGITLSPQEKQKWEERIQLLAEKLRPLLDEIQELKLQIRLKKQKMNCLK